MRYSIHNLNSFYKSIFFHHFSDEDEDYKQQVQQLRESIPFAVVGANAMVEVHGKKIRGRQYPWGVVEVENPAHCDFVKLRTMLITHMQDLQVKLSHILRKVLALIEFELKIKRDI